MDVRYAGSPVQRSPFVVPVGLAFDPAAVRVSGEGISGTVLSSLPTQFAVDTRDAGDADLNIRILVRRTPLHRFHTSTSTRTRAARSVPEMSSVLYVKLL